MDAVHGSLVSSRSRLERSSHTAFIEDNVLFVWGGYQAEDGEDVVLPSDELWLFDLYNGIWQKKELTGDVPPDLTGFCGSYLNGTLSIFAGCDSKGFSNNMFTVDLGNECYVWKKLTHTFGKTPSPRKNHSCWVHRDRVRLLSPEPATAVLGNKGYISGGVESAQLNLYCLDLDTWVWTCMVNSESFAPMGRSMHSMTATPDGTLFVFGGFGTYGAILSDAWQYNLHRKEWTKVDHQHKDKHRVGHTSCLGNNGDIVVFGGSRHLVLKMDLVDFFMSPWQEHCSDVMIFQTQLYPLSRLCEDFIRKNNVIFEKHLNCLPSIMQNKLKKRKH